MAMAGFAQLFVDADARRDQATVADAGGDDPTVLEALRQACDRGWVVPILVGGERAIRATAAAAAIDLNGFRFVDAEPEAIAPAAVAEVRQGRASMLMKGRISTPALLHAVLDPSHGLRAGRVICQVVLMEILRDARRFLLADTGITVSPNLAKLTDILLLAVEVAHALGVETPRVALMAATETRNDAMPETLLAAELQHRGDAGEFAGCVVQGPLSFDLAYAAEAAGKKHIAGTVAGAADLMVFPSLLAANLTVKAIMYTADCRFGGVLRGTSAPVVFMSRADNTATRLNSLALALRMCDRAPLG